jgi:hypothetical protein
MQHQYQQPQPIMQAYPMLKHPQMIVPCQMPQQGNNCGASTNQDVQHLLYLLQGNAAAQGQHQQGHYQGGHHGRPL